MVEVLVFAVEVEVVLRLPPEVRWMRECTAAAMAWTTSSEKAGWDELMAATGVAVVRGWTPDERWNVRS